MSEYNIPYNLSYVFPKEMMEEMANEVRELSGTSELMHANEIIEYIKNANNIIIEQSNLITAIISLLEEKGAI